MFDLGTRWEYGISYDWLGELLEQVSGETLEEYFRRHIFEPLGMTDTFFNVPAEKEARVVALQLRRWPLLDGPAPPESLGLKSLNFSGSKSEGSWLHESRKERRLDLVRAATVTGKARIARRLTKDRAR